MDLLVFLGAILITYLLFNWLFKVIKASLTTAISITLLVLFLQLFFGVNPEQLWQQILDLPETLRSLLSRFRFS